MDILIQPNSSKHLKPKDFPLKEMWNFKKFHGFDSIIRELEEKPSLFNFDHLSYLNDLLWPLAEINKNKENWFNTIDEIGRNKHINESYGGVFYFHLLWLLQAHSEETVDVKESEELNKIFKEITYHCMNILLKLSKTEVILSKNLLPFKISNYYATVPNYVESWVADGDRIEFYPKIYFYLNNNGNSDEEIVCFFKTLNYFLGLLNSTVLDYPCFINSILSKRANIDPKESDNESKALLFWILFALRDNIGFEATLQKYPSFEKEIKKQYSIFNEKAKLLKCSPDQDVEPPSYTMSKNEDTRQLEELSNHSFNLNFEDFLTPESRQILPILKKLYAEGKFNRFAYMLFALKDLGFHTQDFMLKQTEYHTALQQTFGHIGSRANLNIYLLRLNSASKQEQLEIKRHVLKIKEAIKQNNLQVIC